MMERRDFLKLAGLLTGATAFSVPAIGLADRPKRLLFVHGRDQQGQDPKVLQTSWLNALNAGAKSLGRQLPGDVEIAFPFYGDVLAKLTQEIELPLVSEISKKGGPEQDEFLLFQHELAEEMRQKAGVTDAEIDAEYGPGAAQEKGPLNWGWVQAILRALDKHGGGLGERAIERFTRDVFLYIARPAVRSQVDKIVSEAITSEPTIVVAHSLGTVVAYSVLTTDERTLNVPLYLSVGSPLGIRTIRDRFKPVTHPKPVTAWYNAFDDRDVVALNPLNATNFGVAPPIENYGGVKNATDDRHGISGYLDDKRVSAKILDAVS